MDWFLSKFLFLFLAPHKCCEDDRAGDVDGGRNEGNGLFNDALNTFYLRLYGVRYMVKDHSDSDRGNPLPSHGLLFSINSKGSFICTIHRQVSTYHGLYYTSHGSLAGKRNSSMGSPHEGSIRRPIAP